MATKFVLRCQTKSGQHLLETLTGENTVEDLKACLFSVTGINPQSLKVLVGYPRKPIDLSNNFAKLYHVLPRSGETLYIEEVPQRNHPKSPLPRLNKGVTNSSSGTSSPGILMRRVVPANNSCLFTSIYFAISGGDYDEQAGRQLRHVIAEVVAADPVTYSQAFLGKPNKEYCTWILNEDNWGGAIEISILSRYYGTEIVAVDTQNVSLMRFGEDANYPCRIFLIYDGIHYDPLMLEPLEPGKEVKTIFPRADDTILELALEVAQEAKTSRQYTDIQNFTLRCLVCSKGLKGQSQAQQHAIETGHINFGEI